ncbi:hypothetical protein HMPREF9371_2210 [Neisseria shayeganii 871]|uniref:Uncharacterized protein n=1 Tax=Neisseria shayeganii 871 TaxID=1032488 RepID=G4CKS0_9NEIS|nr:hypothetical protein HMPREF9371_2210 [Neisseria shayeganii 871]
MAVIFGYPLVNRFSGSLGRVVKKHGGSLYSQPLPKLSGNTP